MAQSGLTINKGTFTSTGITTGATTTYDIAVPVDQNMRVTAWVYISNASASHLSTGNAAMVASYVVSNKNGTLNAMAALNNSDNPMNSNTAVVTGYTGPDGVQGMDPAGAGLGWAPTATWSISGTNARLSVVNVGATTNILVYWESHSVGST